MADQSCIVKGRNILGESPVWSVSQQKLYWVDTRAPAIFEFDPTNGELDTIPMSSMVGSIGLRKSGGLVVALQTGLHTLNLSDRTLRFLTDPEAGIPENRFNDGRCDRRGRFWSGTMSDTRREPLGSLYRLDSDHRCAKMHNDLIVPNSICWSPDDKTMYLADTYRDRIMTFDFSIDDGTIANMRIFHDTHGNPGRPDGSTVDEHGYLWNAEYGSGRVIRYAPDGRIDRTFTLPASQVTSCTFGGRNLDILYVTSATQRMTADQLTDQPLAGGLFALDVGFKGLPEPEYGG